MLTARFPDTLVSYRKQTRLHNPEDVDLNLLISCSSFVDRGEKMGYNGTVCPLFIDFENVYDSVE